jgi:hypothetical protein
MTVTTLANIIVREHVKADVKLVATMHVETIVQDRVVKHVGDCVLVLQKGQIITTTITIKIIIVTIVNTIIHPIQGHQVHLVPDVKVHVLQHVKEDVKRPVRMAAKVIVNQDVKGVVIKDVRTLVIPDVKEVVIKDAKIRVIVDAKALVKQAVRVVRDPVVQDAICHVLAPVKVVV